MAVKLCELGLRRETEREDWMDDEAERRRDEGGRVGHRKLPLICVRVNSSLGQLDLIFVICL